MTESEKLDHTPLVFGKHKGKTPSEVAEHDPSYIVWLYDTWADQRRPQLVSKVLADDCRESDPRDYDGEESPFEEAIRQHYDGSGR